MVSAALAVVALIPIPYLAAPTWQVWVVDEAGVPIEGMTVRRVYQNYSTESEDHTEDQITDKQGYAAFPARRSSVSTVRRCIFTFFQHLLLSMRASDLIRLSSHTETAGRAVPSLGSTSPTGPARPNT